MKDEKKFGTIALSLLPIVALMAMLGVVVAIFKDDALSGGSQIALIAATALCAVVARLKFGISWGVIEDQIGSNFRSIAPSILILLLIGALSGSWMTSGIVPSLIYYGLKVLQTDFFLVACCVLSGIVSVMTGSSWTTIATTGVALLGIGQAQGFDTGWTAGAIISGAYFGDKISPLSDTTVLASSATGTPLFSHIQYMLQTTVPSFVVALIVFGIAGLFGADHGGADVSAFSAAIEGAYNISPWLMVVPVVTAIMIARKWPAVIVLFASSAMAIVMGMIFQPEVLRSIAGGDGSLSLAKGALLSLYGDTNLETGNAALNELVSTSGMGGMMGTIWLIICAMCFGGAMKASGMLGHLSALFLRLMRGRVRTVASTIASGLTFNICTGDQYISIILNSEMFKEAYASKGYESRLLSRTTEDAVTVTSVLIPWNTCGMTQATVLGVSTLTYLPYCVFNYVSPLMSLIVAAIGRGIKVTKRETGEKE